MTLRSISGIAAAALAWLIASSALADATVHLKNGGLIRGELMESLPDQHVSVRLSDGTVRTVPWAQVARVDDGEAPPPAATTPPPATAPPPAATPPPAAAPPPPGPQDLSLDDDVSQEIARLRAERDGISNGGPAVMMVLGGLGFLFTFFPGVVLLASGELCDDVTTVDSSSTTIGPDCTNVTTVGLVLTLIGVGSGAIGIWGLVLAMQNSERRSELDGRIEELEQQRTRLSLGLLPLRGGAGLRLRLAF